MAKDSRTNSKNFQHIIQEYENVTDTLTSQLEVYEKEQEMLTSEINVLLVDNKRLSQTVTEVLDSRSDLQKEFKEKEFENVLVDNLKKQLDLTLKEKDSVVQLWQNALRNIDHLEEELKLYEGRSHGYFSKPEVMALKKKYQGQLKDLQEKLMGMESKFKEAFTEWKKKFEDKQAELQEALESRENSAALIQQLQTEKQKLQEELNSSESSNKDLEVKLKNKKSIIKSFQALEIDAKKKVAEAVEIIETAFVEKDAALSRENVVKEELSKLTTTLMQILDETPKKVQKETENVKQAHELKINEVQQNMQKLQQELNTKSVELEKHQMRCKLLEDELERINKGNICDNQSNLAKMLTLEKNLEATFQKLLLSERKNIQVTAEKNRIKADLDQMASHYEGDIKLRDVEKQKLQREIKGLRQHLKTTTANLTVVANELNTLNSKIKLMDAEIKDKLEEKEIKHKEVLNSVESKNLEVQDDLRTQLELHVNLNARYKKEMHEMIHKFEKRTMELKHANRALRNKLNHSITESIRKMVQK